MQKSSIQKLGIKINIKKNLAMSTYLSLKRKKERKRKMDAEQLIEKMDAAETDEELRFEKVLVVGGKAIQLEVRERPQ